MSEFARYKNIHILCKSQSEMYVYTYKGDKLHWVTDNKSLSADIGDRASVSSEDEVEKIIDMINQKEIE